MILYNYRNKLLSWFNQLTAKRRLIIFKCYGPFLHFHSIFIHICLPGRVAQSVTCLATDAVWLQIQGSWVRSRSGPIDWSWNNFYGHSPLAFRWFKKGCCLSYKPKYVHQVLGLTAQSSLPVRWTDCAHMTMIAVDWGVKPTSSQRANN